MHDIYSWFEKLYSCFFYVWLQSDLYVFTQYFNLNSNFYQKITVLKFRAVNMLFRISLYMSYFNDFKIACGIFSHGTSKGPLCSHSILRFRIAIFIKVSYWILWAASILLRIFLCMKYVEDFKIACVIFFSWNIKTHCL